LISLKLIRRNQLLFFVKKSTESENVGGRKREEHQKAKVSPSPEP